MSDLFAGARPPDPRLFYRHHDPGDVRLGAVTSFTERTYDAAEIVILGCPQDEGVRRNGGRPGARAAPAEIRRALYRLALGPLAAPPGPPRLFDLGDTPTDGSLEETHDRHRALARQVLADGKTLVSLGGGNDLSYPDCSAAAELFPDLLAFNLDAHLDVRPDEPRNSGTPYRQLLEEGLLAPDRFVEVGYQPFATARTHLAYLERLGVRAHSLDEVLAAGLTALLEEHLAREAGAVFWGIDLDVVTSAEAPGVSAPNPAGLPARELLRAARLAGSDPRSRVLELTEVNPEFDLDGRTSRLAAVAVHAFLTGRHGHG